MNTSCLASIAMIISIAAYMFLDKCIIMYFKYFDIIKSPIKKAQIMKLNPLHW